MRRGATKFVRARTETMIILLLEPGVRIDTVASACVHNLIGTHKAGGVLDGPILRSSQPEDKRWDGTAWV